MAGEGPKKASSGNGNIHELHLTTEDLSPVSFKVLWRLLG